MSNQYAAMPSIHIVWATWSAVVLFRLARRPVLRTSALLYPMATCVVILSTGNHFEADAVAGLAVIAAGFACLPAPADRASGPSRPVARFRLRTKGLQAKCLRG